MTAIPKQLIDAFSDPRWRLSNLYWITDKEGKKVKFEPNWAQQDLLDQMWYCNILLKARQLGMTTFIQLFMLDACVFNSNVRAGVVAHSKDDAENIFKDKVKFPYDNLPEGIRQAIHPIRDSVSELQLSNNSALRVATSHRSGTLQYLHISEYGKICAKYPEKAQEIRTGALNTVQSGQFVFIESTAEGQSGDFYEKCQISQENQRRGEKLTPMDFKFFFYPWWRHPDYRLKERIDIPASHGRYFHELAARGVELDDLQKAWYVKKAEQQKGDMKREFPSTPEEAFEAAIEGAYYSEQMAKADSEGRVCNVPYQEHKRVETWWDLGYRDSTAIWFIQRIGRELHVIDYYENSGEGLPHYAKMLESKPYLYERHIWPFDGKDHEKGTGKTLLETGRGFIKQPIEIAPDLGIDDGIEQVRALLSRCWFDKTKCDQGLKALRAYRKEWNDALGVWRDKPLHDWASHGADAFRYGAISDAPPSGWEPIIYPANHISNHIR